MAHIVAAEFEEFAAEARDSPRSEGLAASRLTSFHLNAAGQHGTWLDLDPLSIPRWHKAPAA